MQAAFGNSALPNTPPKWFLEYMEAFKAELLEKSLSRLDKIEEKLENVVAIVAANPFLAANTEKNAVEDTNVSAENRNRVGCDSYVNTDRLIELEKAPTSLNIFPHSSSEIPLHSVNCYVTASPQENFNETVVASEILQDARVPETSNVEHQDMVETPITMDALQDQTDKILLAAEPEYLNKATMTIDNPAGGSKETTGTQYMVEKHQEESRSHHLLVLLLLLGLMCLFAERQQQELAKLQSHIEVQTTDEKDSDQRMPNDYQRVQSIRVEFPNLAGTKEFKLGDDHSLPLLELKFHHPHAIGLRYYSNSAKAMRGVRLSEGKFFPPPEGWLRPGICTYTVICKGESYLLVKFPSSEETMELPLEDDNSLLLTILKSQFSNANGLRVKTEENTVGYLYPQQGKIFPPLKGWLQYSRVEPVKFNVF